MAVYTVFEPRRRTDAAGDRAERFVFIRDRFTWSAFLFGPFWILRHGLWLALIGYVTVVAATMFGLRGLGVTSGAILAVLFLIALLLGFEAATLRRWTLGRRGWTEHGTVIADDLELAERRFFDAWMSDDRATPHAPAAASPSAPGRTVPAPSSDIIGLFPEPGGGR